MSEPFDPYVEWLGLRAANRPLSYYQLFALDDFEDDLQRIATAADAALARVRSVRPGRERQRWQQLLDELLLAKLCLMDPSRKLQLDQQLRSPSSADAAPMPVGNASHIVVEPPRINPDLFPPGMAGPPPASIAPAGTPPFSVPPPGAPLFASPPPNVAGPPPNMVAGSAPFPAPSPPVYSVPPVGDAFPPVSHALPPASHAMPPVSHALPPASHALPPASHAFPPASHALPPVSNAFPPASHTLPPVSNAFPPASPTPPASPMPPVASVPSAGPNQPAGWAGWPMPPSTLATPAPPPTGAPAGLRPAPVVSTPRFPVPAPAPRAPIAVSASVDPKTRQAAPSFSAADAQTQPSPDESVANRPAPRALAPEPLPVSKPVGVPIAIGPRVEPSLGPRPAQSRNHLNLAIGAGVLAVFAMAAIILKPPSDSDDDSKSPPSVAAKPKPAPSETNVFQPAQRGPADDSDASDSPAGEGPAAMPARPQPQPRPTRPRPVVKPSPDPYKTLVAKVPAGESGVPPASANPEKSAAFRQALAEARGALGAREVEEAKKKLGSAKQFAQSAEDHTELARMNSLATYVAGFWNGVRESLKGLQVTDELRFNGMVAAVVDSDANGITLHTPGKNHEFTLKNMPAGLAMTLAQRWFDQSAANKLFLGAFQAVDPQGDKGEARMFWEQATSGGAPADDLLPLLSGTAAAYSPSAGDVTAPPTDKQQALALKQVKTTFQADYKAAKTPDLKLELGKKLLDVAAETENPTERYALLREALDLAAAGGSAIMIGEAADQLASAFKVDPLELKAEGLARAASATNNALAAKEIARAALGQLDEAIREKRSKPAGKLSQAALNAARKSKDTELVKAANAGSQKALELGK